MSCFICATLNNEREGGFLSLRGYRDGKRHGLSSRQIRDSELVEIVRWVHAENWVYGVRRMWQALSHHGAILGVEHTRRIMGLAGVKGRRKGKISLTTHKSRNVDTRPDLVQHDFRSQAPDRLWGADIPMCEP
ncbi:IS3 family transposase [Arcanobacterium phocae]|uniref:IS3 family transposase n=1 Tax=Arcanobacterium phocae TaxID=131112 RepID=UPI001C0F2113